jgi:hypothetical protein
VVNGAVWLGVTVRPVHRDAAKSPVLDREGLRSEDAPPADGDAGDLPGAPPQRPTGGAGAPAAVGEDPHRATPVRDDDERTRESDGIAPTDLRAPGVEIGLRNSGGDGGSRRRPVACAMRFPSAMSG